MIRKCLCRVPILLYHMIPGAYMAVGALPLHTAFADILVAFALQTLCF